MTEALKPCCPCCWRTDSARQFYTENPHDTRYRCGSQRQGIDGCGATWDESKRRIQPAQQAPVQPHDWDLVYGNYQCRACKQWKTTGSTEYCTPQPAQLSPVQPVACVWNYIGPDPMGHHIKPVARMKHEMDWENPPYPASWEKAYLLYAPPPQPAGDYVMVPRVPEPERIESMCHRYDHGHGIQGMVLDDELRQETDEEFHRRQESNRRRMRQLYEEATGQGFYNERTKDNPMYASPPAPVGERETLCGSEADDEDSYRSSSEFRAAWAATGYDYGDDALENVRLGWDLCWQRAQHNNGTDRADSQGVEVGSKGSDRGGSRDARLAESRENRTVPPIPAQVEAAIDLSFIKVLESGELPADRFMVYSGGKAYLFDTSGSLLASGDIAALRTAIQEGMK